MSSRDELFKLWIALSTGSLGNCLKKYWKLYTIEKVWLFYQIGCCWSLNIFVWALWRNYLCTINGIQARCTFIGFSCKIIMQARCTHAGKIWFIFLLAVITNTVHLTSGFFARIFYRHFSLQKFFRFFSHQPVLFSLSSHHLLSFLAVTVSVIKSSCFMLSEVHRGSEIRFL